MRRLAMITALLLVTGTILGSPQNEKKQKKKNKPIEHYGAVVVGTGGAVGARSTQLDIYINEYTTDDEVRDLITMLNDEGQEKVRRKLEKVKKGRIAPTGRVGNDVAVIRAHKTENGKRLILVSARLMPFIELYIGGRSTDYDLSWIVLDLDEEGKGDGQVIVGAKLKFNEEGRLVVESYGLQYLKITNVRRYVPKK